MGRFYKGLSIKMQSLNSSPCRVFPTGEDQTSPHFASQKCAPSTSQTPPSTVKIYPNRLPQSKFHYSH